MNPTATAFVPKGIAGKKAPAPVAGPLGAPPAAGFGADPATLAALAQASHLRAAAPAFVPKTTVSPTAPNAPPPPPPPPPPAGADLAPAGGPPKSPESPSKLSPDANPYTPSRKRTSPVARGAPFPAAPPPQYVDPYGAPAPAPAAAAAAASSTGTPPTPAGVAPVGAAGAAGAASQGTFPAAGTTNGDGDSSGVGTSPTTPCTGNTASAKAPPGPVQYIPYKHWNLAKAPETPKAADKVALNASWTLYADDHPLVFGEAVNKFHDPVVIATATDLESFWRLWRFVPLPSTRTPSFTYMWFRKEIKPNWEDARNKNGGTLSVTLHDRDRIGLQAKEPMDDAWLLTVLAVTGESLPESGIVNGVVMKTRKATTLQVWTNTTSKSQLQALADGLRALLAKHVPAGMDKIDFHSHGNATAPSAKPAMKSMVGKGRGGGAGGFAKPAPKATREADLQL